MDPRGGGVSKTDFYRLCFALLVISLRDALLEVAFKIVASLPDFSDLGFRAANLFKRLQIGLCEIPEYIGNDRLVIMAKDIAPNCQLPSIIWLASGGACAPCRPGR